MNDDKVSKSLKKGMVALAPQLIGQCVVSLIKKGELLSVATLRAELEIHLKPGGEIGNPIADAALAIIDQAR